MNEMQIFSSEQFGLVRCVVIDDVIWFVGKDVAEALGYTNPRKALIDHVDEEDKQVIQKSQNVTLGIDIPNRGLTLINESGMYSLILSSKLDTAKKFKHWVTSEVLPSIRKNGYYALPKVQPTMLQRVNEIADISDVLVNRFGVEKGIALAASTNMVEKEHGVDMSDVKGILPAPKTEIATLNATELGQKLGISARLTNKLLADKKWQFKNSKNEWQLTDEGKKYGELRPYSRNGHNDYQILWPESVVEKLQADVPLLF